MTDVQASTTTVHDAFRAHDFTIARMREKFDSQASSDLTSTYSDSALANDPTNPTLLADGAVSIPRTLSPSRLLS